MLADASASATAVRRAAAFVLWRRGNAPCLIHGLNVTTLQIRAGFWVVNQCGRE